MVREWHDQCASGQHVRVSRIMLLQTLLAFCSVVLVDFIMFILFLMTVGQDHTILSRRLDVLLESLVLSVDNFAIKLLSSFIDDEVIGGVERNG